jgi:hypothetical protein
MDKVYHYNLNKQGLKELENHLSSIKRSLNTQKFRKYLAIKCMKELEKIQMIELSTIQYGISTEEIITYMSSNHYEINDNENTITIYNDATIDVSTKIMTDEAKSKYPNMTLSLAKLIEYGMGYTGATTEHQEEVVDWEYDVNNHGYRGWYYYDEGGERYWTNGIRGRMIFYKLVKVIEKKIYDWISEYWVNESSKSL